MYQPRATYRIQFNSTFTFRDLENIIPYLDDLGIKTIYASPIFSTMSGSKHGYDGTDPNSINPEIGTYEELQSIAKELKSRNMGWIQDFVPNHMAYSIHNGWLCDFMEKGKMSVYDCYFDKNPDEPLMAPFLGVSLKEALEQEQLKLFYNDGQLTLQYFNETFPLNYTAYFDIINHETFDSIDLQPLRGVLERISQITDKAIFSNEWTVIKDSLKEAFSEAEIRNHFNKGLEKLNKNKDFLLKLLDVQFYRLCQWNETNERINYRRFFTINSLICMNIQRPEVFDDYHRLLHQLVKEDIIQGVRIDHVDGLYDPKSYLKDLRELLGEPVYIIVEKILEQQESLPSKWPIEGTSGYDFLAQANQVLINQEAAPSFDHYYREIANNRANVEQLIYDYKERFLKEYMQGEWNNLCTQFKAIFENELQDGITDTVLKNLIAEVLVGCPVYRYYPDALPFDHDSQKQFDTLISIIRKKNKTDEKVLQFFADCFKKDLKEYTEDQTEELLHFWRRCMQLTGPLMAKGVEDTLTYNYPKFLALNEVGNDLRTFGISVPAFHEWIKTQLQKNPISMNATATHDTKRGEDSRSRLQYISSDAQEWLELLKNNTALSEKENDISIEDKIFVIQVIYSSIEWDGFVTDSYKDRLSAFLIKAAREAKQYSNWEQPDEAYEKRITTFAFSLLEDSNTTGMAIREYLAKNKSPIVIHSLAQLILKCTCPGVPDIYQGTELWDFSFVDPDNRKAVDYEHRKALLKNIPANSLVDLYLKDITDPAIKLFVLQRLLQLRKEKVDLFEKGTYEPIKTTGSYLAFSRRLAGEYIVVILLLSLNDSKDGTVELDEKITGSCKNIFTGKTVDISNLQPEQMLADFPLIVLASEAVKNSRKSGILLPLFSLPSAFGIGGMGSEAHTFLQFLAKGKQRIWQLLPLNSVTKKSFFSPYACTSAFAGDLLYIDPVLLMEDGLLEEAEVLSMETDSKREVSYTKVKKAKAAMLAKAWKTSQNKNPDDTAFTAFCEEEQSWLNDFALFTILKEQYKGKPWFEWPKPLRDRDKKAMAEIQALEKEKLSFQKWIQFLFFKQWKQLKTAAGKLNISLMGDIPFYLAHDSCDVWAHRTLFKLNDKGLMLQSAGVPPDYFSETGQLWGMPTYHWEEAAKNDFEWWMKRLKQNSKLFDVVRLDHFRAFYDYWEVPASHDNAIQGVWRKGPQDALFKTIQKHFPDMPFLAEDLGEIHSGVFRFMEQYNLPGMRVLQFGFDPYNEKGRDVPHNFKEHSVAYTGTHDNNTIVGWYHSLSGHSRKTLNEYTGLKTTRKNIHKVMIKMAQASVASWSIILAQDILGLDETCRINTPSTTQQNWKWRLLPHELSEKEANRLAKWTQRFNRC